VELLLLLVALEELVTMQVLVLMEPMALSELMVSTDEEAPVVAVVVEAEPDLLQVE
jgi:hypothetical protein